MGFYGGLMFFNGILWWLNCLFMGFYGGLMVFYWVYGGLMGCDGILWWFNCFLWECMVV